MKISPRVILRMLSVVAVLMALGSLTPCFARGMNFPCHDLRLRYAELSCSRSGINPFHIWNHDLTSEKYYGFPRPDKPDIQHSPAASAVHAYPPYHTFFCWWMPSLPLGVVVVGYVLANVMAFLAVVWILFRHQPDGSARARYWLVLSSLAFCFSYCVYRGNYGILILLAMLAILFDSKKIYGVWFKVLRGVAVAVIMVKPQIGIPICLFLAIEKRFAELLTGGLLCMGGTAFASLVYDESMIELILQIAEIGTPYIGVCGHCDGTFLIFYLLRHFIGSWSIWLWGSCVLGLAIVLTFRMRTEGNAFVRALPLVASIPVWTYSQSHDGVVLVIAVIGIFSIIANRMNQMDRCCCSLLLGLELFVSAWIIGGLNAFNPLGLVWVYRIVHCSFYIVFYLFALSALFHELNRKNAIAPKENVIT